MILITAGGVDDDPISFTYGGEVRNTDTHNVKARVISDLGWYGEEEEPADGGLIFGIEVATGPQAGSSMIDT